jgi:hypothetical protein
MGSEVFEDFGQKVSLCSQLRNILFDYSESSVLKELIQVRSCKTLQWSSEQNTFVLCQV